jgi:glycosyltransferase involved in cell wall biosynthesis
MTAIEQAIKEAGGYWKPDEELVFEGGIWVFNDGYYHLHHLLLIPSFWQALGKARGWKEDFYISMYKLSDDVEGKLWRRGCVSFYKHAFLDHLAEGKDAESFFAAL